MLTYSYKELEQAEHLILQNHEAVEFSRELQKLNKEISLLYSNRIASLNPMLENELIGVGDGIKNSDFNYASKHPIILSRTMPIAKLIVTELQVKYGHAGR